MQRRNHELELANPYKQSLLSLLFDLAQESEQLRVRVLQPRVRAIAKEVLLQIWLLAVARLCGHCKTKRPNISHIRIHVRDPEAGQGKQ